MTTVRAQPASSLIFSRKPRHSVMECSWPMPCSRVFIRPHLEPARAPADNRNDHQTLRGCGVDLLYLASGHERPEVKSGKTILSIFSRCLWRRPGLRFDDNRGAPDLHGFTADSAGRFV